MEPLRRGHLFTGASALLFFWICILLPLVGRAARAQPHYGRNVVSFLAALLPALGLAFLARRILLDEHRAGRTGYPWAATGLTAVLGLLLACLALGLLHK